MNTTYYAGDSTAGSVSSAVGVVFTGVSCYVAAEAYDEVVRELRPERPKFDPYNARAMWNADVLSAAARPGKRPSRQVEFNQVSKMRPIRPRYLSRKR